MSARLYADMIQQQRSQSQKTASSYVQRTVADTKQCTARPMLGRSSTAKLLDSGRVTKLVQEWQL